MTTLSNVTNIFTGLFHSHVIDSEGIAYSFGSNNYGQLGIGSVTNSNIPIKLNIGNITNIATGGYHSILLSNGNVFVTGLGGVSSTFNISQFLLN